MIDCKHVAVKSVLHHGNSQNWIFVVILKEAPVCGGSGLKLTDKTSAKSFDLPIQLIKKSFHYN